MLVIVPLSTNFATKASASSITAEVFRIDNPAFIVAVSSAGRCRCSCGLPWLDITFSFSNRTSDPLLHGSAGVPLSPETICRHDRIMASTEKDVSEDADINCERTNLMDHEILSMIRWGKCTSRGASESDKVLLNSFSVNHRSGRILFGISQDYSLSILIHPPDAENLEIGKPRNQALRALCSQMITIHRMWALISSFGFAQNPAFRLYPATVRSRGGLFSSSDNDGTKALSPTACAKKPAPLPTASSVAGKDFASSKIQGTFSLPDLEVFLQERGRQPTSAGRTACSVRPAVSPSPCSLRNFAGVFVRRCRVLHCGKARGSLHDWSSLNRDAVLFAEPVRFIQRSRALGFRDPSRGWARGDLALFLGLHGDSSAGPVCRPQSGPQMPAFGRCISSAMVPTDGHPAGLHAFKGMRL